MDTRLTINSVGNVSIGNAGNPTLSSAIDPNIQQLLVPMNGRISFDNDYPDTARGPTKLYYKMILTGLADLVSNNYLDVYTAEI